MLEKPARSGQGVACRVKALGLLRGAERHIGNESRKVSTTPIILFSSLYSRRTYGSPEHFLIE